MHYWASLACLIGAVIWAGRNAGWRKVEEIQLSRDLNYWIFVIGGVALAPILVMNILIAYMRHTVHV